MSSPPWSSSRPGASHTYGILGAILVGYAAGFRTMPSPIRPTCPTPGRAFDGADHQSARRAMPAPRWPSTAGPAALIAASDGAAC